MLSENGATHGARGRPGGRSLVIAARMAQAPWTSLGAPWMPHGCPQTAILGIHGQHTATARFCASVSTMDAGFGGRGIHGGRAMRTGMAQAVRGALRRRSTESEKRRRQSSRQTGPGGALSLSTAFAPACGHMTDRRRYRDSRATRPSSESRGDIRYLLCLREIVPRIQVPTPAFRGSFRFEHYPLTGAAESS